MNNEKEKDLSEMSKKGLVKDKIQKWRSRINEQGFAKNNEPPMPAERLSKRQSKQMQDDSFDPSIKQTLGDFSNKTSFSEKQSKPGVVQIYGLSEGKYEIMLDTVKEIFGKVQDKLIAIYCIAGKFRSGKSFMLSLFHKYLLYGESQQWMDRHIENSFKYNDSPIRVTTGIWITKEPVIKKNKDGKEVAVFLMDTQGWFDDKTSHKDNTFIFALATLFSSVMIFNVEKRIGEDDFQYLQSFSNHARLLDKNNNDEPFQELTFLIRDWSSISNNGYQIGYYDDQTSVNDKNFVKDMIYPRDDQHINAQKRRELLCATYDKVSGFLLPYPGNVISLEQFDSKKLDKSFKTGVRNIVSKLFDQDTILTKQFGKIDVSGSYLLDRVHIWKDIFKIQCTPEMLSINISYQLVSDQTQYQLSYQTSIAYFNQKMRSRVCDTLSSVELRESLENIKFVINESLHIFSANRELNDQKLKKMYSQNIKEVLNNQRVNYEFLLKQMIKSKEHEKLLELMKSTNVGTDSNSDFMQKTLDNLNDIKNTLAELKSLIVNERAQIQEIRREESTNWFKKFIGSIVNIF